MKPFIPQPDRCEVFLNCLVTDWASKIFCTIKQWLLPLWKQTNLLNRTNKECEQSKESKIFSFNIQFEEMFCFFVFLARKQNHFKFAFTNGKIMAKNPTLQNTRSVGSAINTKQTITLVWSHTRDHWLDPWHNVDRSRNNTTVYCHRACLPSGTCPCVLM